MKKSNEIIAIIPARGGSKGVPRKNIKNLGGFPLIAYSIAAAKLSKKIDRVIVSTDSEEFAEIARKFGAEVPFMRPAELAKDKSPDDDWVLHALDWMQKNEDGTPKYIVHLRPTTPLRNPEDIDSAIERLEKNPNATSLRSGYEMNESPYKLFGIENEYFTGLFPDDPRPEYWNLPRQTFPPVHQPDGYVDILITNFVLKNKRIHGDKILSFVSQDTGEIDKEQDFEFIEYNLKNNNWEIYKYLSDNFK